MTGWGRTERAYEWLKPIAVVDAELAWPQWQSFVEVRGSRFLTTSLSQAVQWITLSAVQTFCQPWVAKADCGGGCCISVTSVVDFYGRWSTGSTERTVNDVVFWHRLLWQEALIFLISRLGRHFQIYYWSPDKIRRTKWLIGCTISESFFLNLN